ncbi:MAG: AbrB/MazE/SpoVT family DNA-binding domain-containing protein [Candidatus Bathyarchaeota archaeon]
MAKGNQKKEEMVFTAYVRIEGRITIPMEIRDILNIKRGDPVECRIKKVR